MSIAERLIVENLLFFTLATSFLRFKAWLSSVIVLGILLPLVAMLWELAQGDRTIVLVFVSYFVMLGLQILSESLTVKQFQSCVWVTIPCLYLPYRLWQLYSGLTLINLENGLWVQSIFIAEMVLWTFNYGVHLSQIPRLMRWESSLNNLNV